ncbi:hypothetical protein SDRG_10858 [Saprolegnia diclina VS20]|uniref:Ankyrin repeat-containing domain n=1 Tax=Saprolegnia diclina (strain VS20) TaxID=1156394 RepID=T0QDN0_SAPDV|nr:hypothetical protein SDRG_10858 [Saprolegnia diclina VS20]EQC31695.1 hypothetical protein SDRG_10858 [Saprolegnia diclina VS20]|eukprot:XP_008615094.1 hypothetical protein SDRG_10858 [Saprolegnia diclina VS20]
MPTGFTDVLQSDDLLPLIARFSNGVTQDVCALRRACRGYSVAPGRAPYAAFQALFEPWFARRGTLELHQLCQVHLFVYALDFAHMEVLRWFAAEHRITSELYFQGWQLEFPTASTNHCPDLAMPHYKTVGSSAIYTHFYTVRNAAIRNHVDILRLSLNLRCDMRFVWEEACRHGHLAVVEFAQREEVSGWLSRYVNVAALNGHLHLIKFFHEHDYNGFNKATIEAAVQSGNLALDAMCQAAASSKLNILRWLVTQRNASQHMHKVLETAGINRCEHVLAYLWHGHGMQLTPQSSARVSRRRQREHDEQPSPAQSTREASLRVKRCANK